MPPETELTPRQERFIVALLSSPSVVAAARKAKVTEQTAHQWLHHHPEFARAFRQARRKVLDKALLELSHGGAEAVRALVKALAKAGKGKDARLVQSLADSLLNHLRSLCPPDDLEERLAALELKVHEYEARRPGIPNGRMT